MKEMLRMFVFTLWKNSKNIAIIIIFTVISSLIYIGCSNNETKNVNIYQSSFDLTKVPPGMVIWSHGVPGTEMNFIHADTSARYEFFDIGVLTKTMVVYQIRIPFYSLNMFKVGFQINYLPKQQKNGLFRNPSNSSYVYRGNEVKKLVNN